jgi:predicted GNAT family N-acyltransferase
VTTSANPTAVTVKLATTQTERAACFAIRTAVFVEEQGVAAKIEFDELDETATHFLALVDGVPVGAARIVDRFPTAKIGRVAVLPAYRSLGIGVATMRFATRHAATAGFTDARLHSQTSAVPFYERLGFAAEGDEFLEADIPHFRMRRTLP